MKSCNCIELNKEEVSRRGIEAAREKKKNWSSFIIQISVDGRVLEFR